MSQQRIRMLIDNIWDEATLSVAVGTAIETLSLENTQVPGRSKSAIIIPTALGSSTINFELDGLYLANGIVLYRHFLSNVSQWKIELFDAAGQSGNVVYDSDWNDCVLTKTLGELDWLIDPLVSSTFDNWPYKFSQLWFDGAFFQSGRISIIDAGSDVHEIGRIYLGTTIQPNVNFAYNHGHKWNSNEVAVQVVSGGFPAAKKEKYREFTFDLSWIDEIERPLFSEANRKVGISEDWFISLYPEQGGQKENDYAMACRYVGSAPEITNTFDNNYAIKIAAREA